MSNPKYIADSLSIPLSGVDAVVSLLDDGNTIPFISRYRKEATGGLDEEQIRNISEELTRLRALDERRTTILKSIQNQGKLTPGLEKEIKFTNSRADLEDLYQPYKPKRKTRASSARDKGLEPLAKLILGQKQAPAPLEEIAGPYINDQVPTVEDAWQGARDIAAETISDHPRIRQHLRKKALQNSLISTARKKGGEDQRQVYQDYYQFEIQSNRIRPHQTLAINRAEEQGILTVKLSLPDKFWEPLMRNQFSPDPASPFSAELKLCIADAASRLLLPAIFRDVRRTLTEKAEDRALQIFSKNLRALLLQPPLAGYTIMGLDPGYRTGCKVAVVDPTGKVLDTGTIFPVPPRSQVEQARNYLIKNIQKRKISLIVIGNGTASRETELFVADVIKNLEGVNYLITSEAGASVYSASKLAGRELPDMDVTFRGAVSIARRVQDPLAELVKIDPQSLGVGMYQHDVNQTKLKEKLAQVVESVVNQVGVEINTASPSLLSFISGIGPGLAKRIVAYRDKSGNFMNRENLQDIPGMGEKTYQQAAGFLRVREGDNPLDSTAIHPESYFAAEQVINQAGIDLNEKPQSKQSALVRLSEKNTAEDLAASLKIGVPTLVDIFKQLVQPGRDPREDLPKPFLRKDVLTEKDLVEGMELQGTVQNVVEFGAFIDLGVKNAGLLHRSKIPAGVDLNLGDIIRVTIQQVDLERGRISLGWAGS
ncbi:MAG: RNA-binding transcriptional accessory protein [Chloroflexota bacterium]|nr:MAG: RNA-binding transcriptional accessory protein [Chloroflexota bacterium]